MAQLTLTNFNIADGGCPECGETFSSERGMKMHHSHAHGESIAGKQIVCDSCGCLTWIPECQITASNYTYCSESCRATGFSGRMNGKNHPQWDGGGVEYECDYCGEVNTKQKCNNERRFCSNQCHSDWRSENLTGEDSPRWTGGVFEVECEVCGDPIEVSRSKIDVRRFCSRECYAAHQRELTGPDNPLWEGGESLYDSVRAQLPGDSWYITRKRVREQYDNTCQLCGIEKDGLPVHHIVPLRAGGTNADELLMPFCQSCHMAAEAFTRTIPEVSSVLSD